MKHLLIFCVAICLVVQCQSVGAQSTGTLVPSFKRGINLSRPFGFPLRVGATNAYVTEPFTGQLGLTQFTDDKLDRIVKMGFDFVRLPVDPGPFITASTGRRAVLDKQLLDFILKLNGRGLKVLVDSHTSGYQSDWKVPDILPIVQGAKYQAYGSFLVAMARLLKPLPVTNVALEIMNEPQPTCVRSDGGEDWLYTQRRLFWLIRAAAPVLPLVVTGTCWSSVDGLILIKPSDYDAATLFDIHFYDPHDFTHQSLSFSTSPLNRIQGLSYPYTSSTAATTLASSKVFTGKQVPALASTTALDNDTATYVNRYYSVTKPDKTMIEKRFAQIKAWATKNAVPPSRVIVGEFGVVRWDQAIENGSRGRWLVDVKAVTEANGFGWALWDYDKVFGIVMDYPTQTLDVEVVKALGLTAP